ncbi:hypothetical protein Calab_2228 [Caldithrix abyssi DSM 13497]|uniref:Peptidase MA-like domain-containing protein n=1 Tax=Caldithrix abyssi DSM 13497 TaxID=880073 RepID=H1XWK0_CALAY|nr:hypothetical protein [Caldithrix abyssi]APF17761.1 hypothetical protein Cabys_1010 [Caldithrix abyssi DSM 13497]EHO41838.1 hypothetical protein Calab_2228 [Caldithrix abyssi DSM 13497]
MAKNKGIFFAFLIFISFQSINAGTWQKISGQYASVEFEKPYQSLAANLLYLADQEVPRLARIHGIDSVGLQQLPRARIILTDRPDISNGYAFGNSVVIYAQSSMYMLYWSEEAPWYYTVLTHELAHWVTFQATRRKLNRLGVVASLTIPRWFYEGMAQYCAETWNIYRGDQSLRQALLYGNLNYRALENLNKGRLLYASANAFVRFLVSQYGDSSLIRLFSYKPDAWFYDFDKAFKAVYKKSPQTLFKEFIRHSVLYYGDYLSALKERKFKEIFSDALIDQPFGQLWVSIKDSILLVYGREKSHYRFSSILLVQIVKGKAQIKKRLSDNLATRVVLSPDRRYVAFGEPVYKIEANQTALRFSFKIVDLRSFKQNRLPGTFRARYGAFDFAGNFYLVEIRPEQSAVNRFVPEKGIDKEWLAAKDQTIGPIAFTPRGEMLFIAEKNGQRHLFKYSGGKTKKLVGGRTFLDLTLLTDRTLALSSVKNNHIQIELFDLQREIFISRFVDQFEYYFSDVDSSAGNLVAYRYEADGQRHFYEIPYDSLLKSGGEPGSIPRNQYGFWQRQEPVRQDSVFARRKFLAQKERYAHRKDILPYFPMERIFTFAMPLYDQEFGWGLYGMGVWTEALQRQMLLTAFYLMPEDYHNSFFTLSHFIKAFNLNFISDYYHGPVIFSFQKNDWVPLTQDRLSFTAQKWIFPFQSSRWRMSLAVHYRYLQNRFVERYQDFPLSFKFHGPGATVNLMYRLPSKRGIFFPIRYFSLKSQICQTVESDYIFSIVENDLTLKGQLFLDELGFSQRFTYLRQSGSLPPLKTVGLDRFYQLDFPRDYTYTRTVRGFNEDVLTSQLLWSSTELRYLIQEKTPYKLIFWPVDLLSIDAFFDYARVKRPKVDEISSVGIQLSTAEQMARLSAGFARSFVNWKGGNSSWFFRLTIFMDEFF